jgi:hypothetical protein
MVCGVGKTAPDRNSGAVMSDKVWAIVEFTVGVALLLSLLRLLLPVRTAQRITRFIKRLLFGDKI